MLVLPDITEEHAAFFLKCQGVQEDDEILETSGTAHSGTRRYISKYQIAVLLTAKTICFVFIWLLCDQTFPE
jgi:hypothetical protein